MSSKVFAAIGLASVISVGAISVYTINYINNSQQTQDIGVSNDMQSIGEAIVIKDDNRDYVSEIKDKVEKGMIGVRMTQNWVFQDGGKSSNAYLANSQRNSFDMRFQIILEETGEIIMTSPDVPVGSCIENFPLSVTLAPGKYDIIVAHQQLEDGEVVNMVRTSSVMVVK